MKLKLITGILILLVLLGIGLFYYIVNNVTPYGIIKPIIYEMSGNNKPIDKLYQVKSEKIKFQISDSIYISALYYKTDLTSDRIIIFLHGINSLKEYNIFRAKFLLKNNYNLLLPDLRAHGESSGKYCTYGYFEKYDLVKIIDSLLKINPNFKIGLWGTSMGAAIGIQAMVIDNRIKFGIFESTFTNLDQIVKDYTADYIGFRWESLSGLSLQRAAKIAGFNAEDVSPLKYAASITNPVLYIHGDSDNRIDLKYGLEIYKNLSSKDKELYIVKGASHLDVNTIGGSEYYNKILSFLNNQ